MLKGVYSYLRILLEELAQVGIVSQDGDILPGGRMPIGPIISLFGAFESVSVSVVVLTGVNGSLSVEVSSANSVSNEQSLVSITFLAILIVSIALVHSVFVSSSIGIELVEGSNVIFDGVGGFSISDLDSLVFFYSTAAHVLDDDVTVQLGVSASMLIGPFDAEQRFFVEGHGGSLAISSFGIVLGIHQSVGIVSVGVGFTQSAI